MNVVFVLEIDRLVGGKEAENREGQRVVVGISAADGGRFLEGAR